MQYFEERDGKLIFRYNGETVQVEAWGQDSLRVRSRVLGEISEECSALTEEVAVHDAVISIQGEDSAEITNGRIKAVLYRQGWGNALQITFYNEKGETQKANAATRNFIAYVPQGNTLFSGTVRENIRMGNLNATEEEMNEALKLAAAYDFVQELPKGIDTAVSYTHLTLPTKLEV